MAVGPVPFAEETLKSLEPLLEQAVTAFGSDVSYGVDIISAGRKAVERKRKSAQTTAARRAPVANSEQELISA